jgi:hypothetical protein
MLRGLRFLVLVFLASFAMPSFGLDLSYLTCVKVASSEHGRSVAVADTHWVSVKNQLGAVKATEVTFQIFPEAEFYGVGKLNAPVTLWQDMPSWTVTLVGEHAKGCLIPLVSDIGEYLILLSQPGGLTPQEVVMRLYKAPSRTAPEAEQKRGVFVKELTLQDVSPGRQVAPALVGDGTPQWFAGGVFNWGRDNQSLLFKSGLGDSVSINLLRGSVTDCNKQRVYACTGY